MYICIPVVVVVVLGVWYVFLCVEGGVVSGWLARLLLSGGVAGRSVARSLLKLCLESVWMSSAAFAYTDAAARWTKMRLPVQREIKFQPRVLFFCYRGRGVLGFNAISTSIVISRREQGCCLFSL